MDDFNEELGVGELNETVEEIGTRNETPKESLGDKKVVRYNEDGSPIGENGAKLKSFIGLHLSLIKDLEKTFFKLQNWLTTKYIMSHKDEPQLLQVPPEKYSFIEQNHWEEFIRSRQLQQDRQSKNKYNHRISRKGYANLKEEMTFSGISSNIAKMEYKLICLPLELHVFE
uniref:Serine/threonine-protein kinase nek2 n=1 Tax=Cucumis melo TaxID=3656 RepID=A0A9I9E795_CUCME